jgi:hypothetical protein
MSVNQKMTALADAIRSKTGETGRLSIDAMTIAVDNISVGVELPELTNEGTAADLLSGKELIDDEGNVVTGTMPTATQATPSIAVNSNGLITASATQSAGYVSAGTKSATKQLTTKGTTTYTPSTTSKTIASGVYLTGTQTIEGDANLIPANIISGKSIFGVAGTAEVGNGGSSTPTASKNEVNFYDYDGTILYSYTTEEAQALTELPPLPAREGLVCQGWNYDLATIKSYNRAVDIGAIYITDDGKTRLYIRIAAEGRMTVPLYFSQTVSNGVTIDWGDGSSTETLSGNGNKNTSHTYANIGDYVITLEVISGTLVLGNDQSSCCIMGSTGNNGRVYCNMLQKVEIGNSVTTIGIDAFAYCSSLASITIPDGVTSINGYAFACCSSLVNITIPNSVTTIGHHIFYYCYSLASITIPNSVTSISDTAFHYCYSLASITIPNSVTSISDTAFYNCYSLASITIPNSVTSIGWDAFSDCTGMAFYDFTSHTSVPTLSSTSTFSGIPSDCIIKVPAALYDEWVTATNWSIYLAIIRDEFGNGGSSGGSNEKISFTINMTTYEANDGMTWAEWVNSEYNTDGYFIEDGMVAMDNGAPWYEYVCNSDNYKNVSTSALIIANTQYLLE